MFAGCADFVNSVHQCAEHTIVATEAPTAAPTPAPTPAPSSAPTNAATDAPTKAPTSTPTPAPTPATGGDHTADPHSGASSTTVCLFGVAMLVAVSLV